MRTRLLTTRCYTSVNTVAGGVTPINVYKSQLHFSAREFPRTVTPAARAFVAEAASELLGATIGLVLRDQCAWRPTGSVDGDGSPRSHLPFAASHFLANRDARSGFPRSGYADGAATSSRGGRGRVPRGRSTGAAREQFRGRSFRLTN